MIIWNKKRKIIAPEALRSVIREVARKHDLPPVAFLEKTKTRKIAWARQELMARLNKELNIAPVHIGRVLGGLDRTTVVFGIRQHFARVKDEQPMPQYDPAEGVSLEYLFDTADLPVAQEPITPIPKSIRKRRAGMAHDEIIKLSKFWQKRNENFEYKSV